MENIKIQTTQNIAINHPVASVGERIVSGTIDAVIIYAYAFIVAIIGSMSARVLLFLLLIPVPFYHLACEILMNGQSWGKKIMKIKVVKTDGTQPAVTTYLVRWIFRLVDVLVFFGAISVIVIIINGKGQRLGDIAAGTTVIRLKEKKISSGMMESLPVNYNLTYPQVNRLNDSDIGIIRDLLEFLNSPERGDNSPDLAEKARKALEAKMDIRSELPTAVLLNTILNDYIYIHSR